MSGRSCYTFSSDLGKCEEVSLEKGMIFGNRMKTKKLKAPNNLIVISILHSVREEKAGMQFCHLFHFFIECRRKTNHSKMAVSSDIEKPPLFNEKKNLG